MGELVSQAEYARRRGISKEAVSKRTVSRGGPLPVHGPAKQIDVEEADALWRATITDAQERAGHSRHRAPKMRKPRAPRAAPAPDATTDPAEPPPAEEDDKPNAPLPQVTQAKLASQVIKAQVDRINFEKLRGGLVDKAHAVRQVFSFARRQRDAWMNWPGRVAPALAAELGVDQHVLNTALERLVRDHLTELADQPTPELGPG